MAENYDVERIEKKKKCNEEIYYFCKWVGWSEEDNTWETELTIKTYYADKLEEFEKTDYELIIEDTKLIVEEIITSKTNKNGEVMYLCKWVGYHHLQNTWESEETVEYHHGKKLREYQQYQAAMKVALNSASERNSKIRTLQALALYEQKVNDEGVMEPCKYGFDRGLIPEKIIDMVPDAENQELPLNFLIKWKDCDEADLVDASEAREKCPQLVLDYYDRFCSNANTKI